MKKKSFELIANRKIRLNLIFFVHLFIFQTNISLQVQFNLISRELGTLSYKFFAKAFFYLHIINQYETEDYVIIDICIYRDPAMLECMYIDSMKVSYKFFQKIVAFFLF